MSPTSVARIACVTLAFAAVLAGAGSGRPSDCLVDVKAPAIETAAASLYESCRYVEARRAHSVALDLHKEAGNRIGQITCLNGLGRCHLAIADRREAVAAFEGALAVAQDVGPTQERTASHLGAAEALKGMALDQLAHSGGQVRSFLRAAVAHYEDALELMPRPSDRGLCLLGLGTCSMLLGDYASGFARFEEAARVAPRAATLVEVALATFSIGTQAENSGDYRAAFDCFSQAHSAYVVLQDEGAMARSLCHMGYCTMHLAEYGQALDFAHEALDIHRSRHDAAGEARALATLAMCLLLLADYEAAIDSLTEALLVADGIADTIDRWMARADVLYELGLCRLKRGEIEAAADRFDQAIAAYEQIGERIGNWTGVARASIGLAVCLLDRKPADRDWATDLFRRSVTIYEEAGNLAREAAAVLMLGDALLRRHRDVLDGAALDDHVEYYTLALGLAEQVGDEEAKWRAYWGLGIAGRAGGDLQGARCSYEQAIEVVEGIRSRIGVERLSQSYFASVRSLYEEYLDLLDETGASDETMAYAERGRARQLLDMLIMGGSDASDGVHGMSSEGTVDARRVEELARQAPGLLREDEAALVFAWGAERLFTWVVTAEGIGRPSVRRIRQSEVVERICSFREMIEGSPLDRLHAFEDLVWLHELLIAPVEAALAGFPTWVIVPSGPLWLVPFGALRPTRAGAAIVAAHSVAYVPSLASLSYLLSEEASPEEGCSLGLAALTRADDALPSIPYERAQELGEAIRTATQTLSPESYVVEESASERTAIELVEEIRPRYVLFGCHGVFRIGNPLASYLALLPSATDETDDGNLEAREVLGVEGLGGTELVILMACETFLQSFASQPGTAGAGSSPEEERREFASKLTRGDELVGLSRSFLLAGASAVLATRWQVYVPAATEFLPLFARGLAGGRSKAEALRQAQLRLMEMPEFSHDPWKWGPFLLLGNWR